ncbi:MAG: PGPGW domain-containing protein [Acidobacteria bacterium]|nr:PGPGW domain-containing protein [Acidobacteriota bacterium]
MRATASPKPIRPSRRNVTGRRQNSIKRTARKVGIGAVGLVTIALGVVLVPLPGPGWLVIFGGLTVLGSEFPTARRLSDRTKESVRRLLQRNRRR